MEKQSLKNNTIDFQAIFNSVHDLYLIINPQFKILAASDAYLKATMVKRDAIVGRPVFEVFPDNPDDAFATGVENVRNSLETVLRTKAPHAMAVQKYDIRRPVEEGGQFEEHYWSPVNTPVLDNNNNVKYIIHRVEDVTEFVRLKKLGMQREKLTEELRTRTEEMEREIYLRAQEIQESNKKLVIANQEQEKLYRQLEKLNLLKTQFFANVSHELRTPLTLILLSLEKLLAEESLSDYAQRFKIMERNAHTLLRLVNELLDVSRLEAGKVILEYSRGDLANTLRQVAAHFGSYADERHVRFVVDAPSVLSAEFDIDKMQRVLMNLISNAYKYTPPDGIIRCVLTRDEAYAKIIISDSGIGIPPTLRHAIFERFFRIEDMSVNIGGFGLGLAIVKDFIELHGGTIRAGGSKEGGAEFVIDLPLIAPPGTKIISDVQKSILQSYPEAVRISHSNNLVEHETRKNTDTDNSKMNLPLILVVEDNSELVHHISEILSENHRVVTAFNGEEGVAKAVELHPDLILTDIMMPKMDGIQMINTIRSQAELNSVPIIVLTAKNDDQMSAKLLSQGVQDYLSKPFSKMDLTARANNLIRLKKAIDELEQKNRELTIANTELDTFSYSVSHDLKNPLQAIIGFSEILLINHRLDDDVREHLQHVLDSAGRMNEIIRDLYLLAHASRSKINIELINLSEVVDKIKRELSLQDKSRNVEFIIQSDVSAQCDPNLVRIVLENLINNAWKYSSINQNAIIEFGRIDDKTPVYFVRDNGIGFPQEEAEKLFSPFSRLPSAKQFPGTGVGLATVKRIVERHGGQIWVESKVGDGSTFFMTFNGKINAR